MKNEGNRKNLSTSYIDEIFRKKNIRKKKIKKKIGKKPDKIHLFLPKTYFFQNDQNNSYFHSETIFTHF